MIVVTDTVTGEVREFKSKDARLMVAPNGVCFVKADGRTLFASGNASLVFEEK